MDRTQEADHSATAPPQVGEAAVDAELTDVDGQIVRLSSMWTGKPIALVFLRHLGCTFCRQQLGHLKKDYSAFADAGAEVVCVAQGDAKIGKAYTILYELPFPLLLCGNDLAVYRNWGLMRAAKSQMLNPVMLFKGVLSVLQGYKQTEVIGSGSQLGGAFVIDTTGKVRFVHRNRDASDNVDNKVLLAEIRKV